VGSSFRPGAALPIRQLKDSRSSIRGLGLHEELVFLVYAKDETCARKVRDKGEVLALLGSPASTCFFTPFFVKWKSCNCVGTENTASRAGVNGTEVVQSGTNVPYSTDEGSKVGE